jgi:hypothetical protein
MEERVKRIMLTVFATSLALAAPPQPNIPDSVLHVTAEQQGTTMFQVGQYPVWAVAVKHEGQVFWLDRCSMPLKSGQRDSAYELAAVLTPNGVYGDQTGLDILKQQYELSLSELKKWQALAQTYSTNPDHFIQQLRAAFQASAEPTQHYAFEEHKGMGMVVEIAGKQTATDARTYVLGFLDHQIASRNGCIAAIKAGQ